MFIYSLPNDGGNMGVCASWSHWFAVDMEKERLGIMDGSAADGAVAVA